MRGRLHIISFLVKIEVYRLVENK